MKNLLAKDLIFKTILDGVIVSDETGTIQGINPIWTKKLGYTQDELIGQHISVIAKESDESSVNEKIIQTKKTKNSTFFEVNHFTKSGEIIPVEINTNTLVHNKQTYFVSVVRDITNKKRNEQAFFLLANDQLQGMFIVQHGRLVYCNPKVLEILHTSEKKILGKTISSLATTFIHPDDRVVFEQIRDHLSQSQQNQIHYKLRIIDEQNQVKWLELSTTKSYFHAQESYQTTLIDITEHVRNSQKIKKFSRDLLKISDAERNKLSQTLHDTIVQELVSLKLQIQLKKQPNSSDADLCQNVINQISKIIDHTRHISVQLKPQLLDHLGLVSALENKCREIIPSHINWKITRKFPDLTKSVEFELFWIISEAVTNSIKHAQCKTISITSNIQEKTISVADDGQGFDLNLAQHELHFGLDIMRERCQNIQAEFEITSVPQSGTTIIIHLK